MYRRYQPMSVNSARTSPNRPINESGIKAPSSRSYIEERKNRESKTSVKEDAEKTRAEKYHPLLNLIPRSMYNPENGKVFGIFSVDDLLIAALVLVLIDGGNDCEENNCLIYALIYILLSEHLELPF